MAGAARCLSIHDERLIMATNPAWLIGAAVGGFCLAGSLAALQFAQMQSDAARRAAATKSTAVAALLIQTDMSAAIDAAEPMALLIRTNGKVAGFDALAADMMARRQLITAVGLAPGGIITAVAPLDSMGALIGRSLADDKDAAAELREAEKKQAPVMSRPVNLIVDGIGVIVRIPVEAWGALLLQIRLPDVAKRMDQAGAEGKFTLAALDASTGSKKVFAPTVDATLQASTSAVIDVASRRWTLSIELTEPRPDYMPRALAALASASAGLAAALLLPRRIKYQRQQERKS
jgi:hypothetical protein